MNFKFFSFFWIFVFSVIAPKLFAQNAVLKVSESHIEKVFPDEVFLEFLIYSESEKGSVPIENIEAIIRNELIKNQIDPKRFLPSGNIRSLNQNYRKYRIYLIDKKEYLTIYPFLFKNPFIQSLQVTKTIFKKQTLTNLQEKMVLNLWEKSEQSARILAQVANKKTSDILEIDATQVFNENKTQRNKDNQIGNLIEEEFKNAIQIHFKLHKDSIKNPNAISKITVIGTAQEFFTAQNAEINFDLFNNELKKSEVQLSQLLQKTIQKCNELSIQNQNVFYLQDEYEDVIRFRIENLNDQQLNGLIEYLGANKNILNLKIKHFTSNENIQSQNMLFSRALQDARQKANKFAFLIGKNIEKIIEMESLNPIESTYTNEPDWSSQYTLEEWREKCMVLLQKKIKVSFTAE